MADSYYLRNNVDGAHKLDAESIEAARAEAAGLYRLLGAKTGTLVTMPEDLSSAVTEEALDMKALLIAEAETERARVVADIGRLNAVLKAADSAIAAARGEAAAEVAVVAEAIK